MSSFPTAECQNTGSLLFFKDRFTASPQFAKLYREGMNLVDRTAEYLDGSGREEAKRLTPPASLAYTSESIKLTTRLTQLASWLLVRRAIAAGEITSAQGHTHRHRAKLTAQSQLLPEGFHALPETFKALIAESQALYDRILRLERLLNEAPSAFDTSSPINHQIEQIKLAFPTR